MDAAGSSNGLPLREYRSPVSISSEIAVNDDGTRVWIKSDSLGVLWDVETGEDLLRFDAATRVYLDADWQQMIVLKNSRAAIVPTDPQRMTAAACARAPRNLSWLEWKQLMPEQAYRPTCSHAPLPADVVDGIRNEAALLLYDGKREEAQRRVDLLNGWLAQSNQLEALGVDFEALVQEQKPAPTPTDEEN